MEVFVMEKFRALWEEAFGGLGGSVWNLGGGDRQEENTVQKSPFSGVLGGSAPGKALAANSRVSLLDMCACTPLINMWLASKIALKLATPSACEKSPTTSSLAALYCAIRLLFGYGFESCDANSPRNVKSQNLAKQSPVYFCHFSLLVVRNRSWKFQNEDTFTCDTETLRFVWSSYTKTLVALSPKNFGNFEVSGPSNRHLGS